MTPRNFGSLLSLCIFLNLLCFQLRGEEKTTDLDKSDLKTVSFYLGYVLYNEELKKFDSTFDLDQVVEGMKAAHNRSDVLEKEEEKFRSSIKKYQEHELSRMQVERLAEANRFLDNISKEKDVVEVVPQKLYYKIISQGQGPIVQESDSPLLTYTMQTLEKGKEDVCNEIEEPKEVLLRHTHKGFLLGVTGMKEGEKRIIYVHPDLAFGPIFGLIKPNSLIIFEVTIFKVKR